MGCDIHCYVEYRKPGEDRWRDFGGRINPGRDYELFGRLAGVRDDPQPWTPALRGVPADTAWQARWDYWLRVDDEFADEEGYCSRKNAEAYLKFGSRFNDSQDAITNPDWHSATWLTTDEFARAIRVQREWRQEYHALLAAMRSLATDDFEVRIVFWFDN